MSDTKLIKISSTAYVNIGKSAIMSVFIPKDQIKPIIVFMGGVTVIPDYTLDETAALLNEEPLIK